MTEQRIGKRAILIELLLFGLNLFVLFSERIIIILGELQEFGEEHRDG